MHDAASLLARTTSHFFVVAPPVLTGPLSSSSLSSTIAPRIHAVRVLQPPSTFCSDPSIPATCLPTTFCSYEFQLYCNATNQVSTDHLSTKYLIVCRSSIKWEERKPSGRKRGGWWLEWSRGRCKFKPTLLKHVASNVENPDVVPEQFN